MADLISVIIPIYNTERYLRRCVDSVLSQTHQNLEVILVDDGSTDSSPDICDEYGRLDSRVKVLHKANAGVSEARNSGISSCTGEYIAFVDSDDYCLSNLYETLLDCMHRYDVDVSACCWQWETEAGDWTVSVDDIPSSIYGMHTGTQFTEFLYGGGYVNGVVCAPWNKLYKRGLFDGVRFLGSYYEDYDVNDRIFAKDVEIYVDDKIQYVYCMNSNSLTHSSFGTKWYRGFDILINRVSMFASSELIVNNTKLLFCNTYIEYYYRAKKTGIQPYNNKKQYTQYRKEAQTDVKTRLRFLLFDISPALYQTILAWKQRLWTHL